jgi:peroxiredoxin
MPEVIEEKKKFNPTLLILLALGLVFIMFIIMSPEVRPPGELTRVDSPAPGFELEDLDGKIWTLESLKGTVVVINFWATWCPPCRLEMPSLSVLYEKTRDDKNITVLTILFQDTPDAARAYFADNNFNMPVLLDLNKDVADRFALISVPETFIIDKKGILKKHFIGPVEFDSDETMEYLQTLMDQ